MHEIKIREIKLKNPCGDHVVVLETMDWKCCVVCGGGGDLKCPAASFRQRILKRQKTGATSVKNCIFCPEVGGKLHNCSTMNLDHELRRMAEELQDTSLLAKIGGGDLIAIEAKYHLKCLSAYRNKYRSSQRAKKDCTVDRFSSIVKAKSFVELISHIEEGIENGQFIFKLSELHTLYVNRLKSLQCGQQINKTRLKQHLLTHFSQRCQEQSDGKATLLVFNEGLQQMLKDAANEQNYESDWDSALVMIVFWK